MYTVAGAASQMCSWLVGAKSWCLRCCCLFCIIFSMSSGDKFCFAVWYKWCAHLKFVECCQVPEQLGDIDWMLSDDTDDDDGDYDIDADAVNDDDVPSIDVHDSPLVSASLQKLVKTYLPPCPSQVCFSTYSVESGVCKNQFFFIYSMAGVNRCEYSCM